jgi:hypothetical protein
MANFKSLGAKGRMVRLGIALALCVPLVLLTQGKQGKGNKGGKSSMCETVTADAEFLDAFGDGILSDFSIYGDKMYYGLEDTLVCLLKEQDHDFILSTRGGTKYERESGVDRKVTLDFSTPLPGSFNPFVNTVQIVDVLIRVDEVLNDATDYADIEKRFLLWFDVGRDSYQLRFDGTDCELVSVTQQTYLGTGLRKWTIKSTGTETAWLVKIKGVSKKTTVGYFKMPFQITVYETEKPASCL